MESGYREFADRWNPILDVFDVSALATGAGTANYAIRCHGGEVNVAYSYLEGDDYSLHRTDGIVTLSHTRLVGDVSGTVTCVAVSQGTEFYAEVQE